MYGSVTSIQAQNTQQMKKKKFIHFKIRTLPDFQTHNIMLG